MRTTRRVATLVVAALIVTACGRSGPGQATQPGDGPGAPSDGVSPTAAPLATVAGGGGVGGGGKPAGWDQYGKVHVDISGPVSKSADYGFLPAGSTFGGNLGSALNFTTEGTSEILSVLVNPDGTVAVSYTGTDLSMPAAECTTSNWNIGATSGSGSFDCTAPVVIMASGATAQNGKIKGTFEARA
jgi:hypothetical protein